MGVHYSLPTWVCCGFSDATECERATQTGCKPGMDSVICLCEIHTIFLCNVMQEHLQFLTVKYIAFEPMCPVCSKQLLYQLSYCSWLGQINHAHFSCLQSKIVSVGGVSLFKKVARTYLQPALILLCVAGGVRLGAGLVWAYNVKTYFNELYCKTVDVGTFLSWVPVVGGTLGALFGGFLSDKFAGLSGYKGRMWVLILSQVGTIYHLIELILTISIFFRFLPVHF